MKTCLLGVLCTSCQLNTAAIMKELTQRQHQHPGSTSSEKLYADIPSDSTECLVWAWSGADGADNLSEDHQGMQEQMTVDDLP